VPSSESPAVAGASDKSDSAVASPAAGESAGTPGAAATSSKPAQPAAATEPEPKQSTEAQIPAATAPDATKTSTAAAESKPEQSTGAGPTADKPADGAKSGAGPTADRPADGAKSGAESTAAGTKPEQPAAAGAAGATEQTKDEAEADPKATAPGTKAEAKIGSEAKADDKTAGDKKAGEDKAGEGSKDKAVGTAAPSAAAVAAASQGRATRVLRRANPVRVAKSTARTTSAWAKRPSGRLILPALIAALLLGAAGTAGVYLVPKALQSVPSPSATPGFGGDATQSAGAGSVPPAGPAVPPSASGLPGLPGLPSAPVVGATLPGAQPPVGGARPADILTSWAQQTGTKAGIPVVAVQAYGYAELVVGRTTPSCHLTWTTLAAIAKVETAHGSANGAVLNVDGSVAPPIFGLPLDGKGGRQEIRDTDQGALDGDTQFDRAVGPLQFVPQAWTSIAVGNGVDADNNGVSDPNDIDDAALAAAKFLCQGGRDLAKPDAWWDAVLSYNAVRPRAQQVFEAANDYGQRSRV
jgi:hypothetical protein